MHMHLFELYKMKSNASLYENETRIYVVFKNLRQIECMFYTLMCTFCEIVRENLYYTKYYSALS